MTKRLLLISNSTNPGEDYLGWPRKDIKNFLDATNIKRVLFIPYAGVGLSNDGEIEKSYDIYEKRVYKVYKEIGYEIYSIHKEADPVKAINEAEALAVGGGNTFYLVYMIHKLGLMKPIRECVLKGLHYMGWSAGSNLVCPTMRTTNDMPIIEPQSLNCLNLIPFQINPHYLDAHPQGHGGETREQRIQEFLVANKKMFVAGLREASLFQIEDDNIQLIGKRPMRLFKFNQEPKEYEPGSNMDFLWG
ncbi:dipeptidase PepE [Bacteroidota bacterium]